MLSVQQPEVLHEKGSALFPHPDQVELLTSRSAAAYVVSTNVTKRLQHVFQLSGRGKPLANMVVLPADVPHAMPSGTSLPEDDDENIIRDSFMKSYEESQPCQVRIPGMQDFAAAVSSAPSLPK